MIRKSSLLVSILSFIIIVGLVGSAKSEVTTGSGTFKKAAFATDLVQLGAAGTDVWTDAFSTTLTLKGTQCIIIMYTGEVAAGASTQFRALVDGELVEGEAPFMTADNGLLYATHGMNWWKCGLGKGAHTIQIQFKPASDTAFVRKRTLTILYNN